MPKLFASLVNIIMQLSDICEDFEINLDNVHSFEYTKNEWAIAFMQIYEKLYRLDCSAHDNFEVDGKPILKEGKPLGLSTPMRLLILHFHERRIRVAPPAGTYAGKHIEDLEFYAKRLQIVENRVHADYATLPPEQDPSLIPILKTGTGNQTQKGVSNSQLLPG